MYITIRRLQHKRYNFKNVTDVDPSLAKLSNFMFAS